MQNAENESDCDASAVCDCASDFAFCLRRRHREGDCHFDSASGDESESDFGCDGLRDAAECDCDDDRGEATANDDDRMVNASAIDVRRAADFANDDDRIRRGILHCMAAVGHRGVRRDRETGDRDREVVSDDHVCQTAIVNDVGRHHAVRRDHRPFGRDRDP